MSSSNCFHAARDDLLNIRLTLMENRIIFQSPKFNFTKKDHVSY